MDRRPPGRLLRGRRRRRRRRHLAPRRTRRRARRRAGRAGAGMTAAAAPIQWTRAQETRTNAAGAEQTFTTYRAARFPGYRIERWEPGTWGIFHGETFCTWRPTLAAAQAQVAFDHARVTA